MYGKVKCLLLKQFQNLKDDWNQNVEWLGHYFEKEDINMKS